MIRFYNGRILSFEPAFVLSDNEVWTDGSVISYVGPAREDMPVFEREIDLRGDVLMPGFKNAHTHTPMTFLRSYADDMPLHQWLNERIFPSEAKLTDEAVYAFTRLGVLEYLTSGITASFDMYAFSEANAQANIDCGFRTVLTSALNKFDADPTQIERDYLRYNSMSELVTYTLGLHAEYTTSIDRIMYMVGLLEKYREPGYIHCSETAFEVQDCINRYGKTPPQFLYDIGFFRYGGGIYHGVHMTDDDIRLFADNGLWVVTNPASNLKLDSGIAPICKMRRAGVKLAIGTDGPASNNALDMFREMYLAAVLQKILEDDASACDAGSVLEMACVGGAQCMGLNDCDGIAVGKKADLIIIDLNRPNMQPLNNICKNIVYSGSKENVRMTMVNGRILYENGEFFVGESAERIYAEAERLTREIVG